MRLLFVYPDLSADLTNYTGVASYGIALLSAVLKEAGHQVDLYHMTTPPTEEEFRQRIRAAQPDLVAFSANSHYARRLPVWSAWAHAETGAPVAVGGIHATLAPQDVSAIPAVGFTCVGEGESALLELCENLEAGRDPSHIRNLWVRNGTSIVQNPLRPLCQDLDQLPAPDLSLFDFDRLYTVRRGLFPYLMSRGCAFQCSYCCVHTLKKISAGGDRYWRYLSPRRAAEQLRDLVAQYMPQAPNVQFLDTIIFPNRKWLREFAPLYKEMVGKPFSCNLRADFVNEEVAEILQDMGCDIVRMGVESGDEDMTTRVLKRGLTVADIRRAFTILREYGMQLWAYNMVGLPEETLPKALKTVRLNAELRPDLAIPFIFYPYPGTELHELCASEGYLTDREYDHYFMGVVTRLPTFRATDILFVHRFFVPLMRLYGVGRAWPVSLRLSWWKFVDGVLTSRLLPRGVLVWTRESYKRFRHGIGEFLVDRSPRLYRMLGGTDPV